MYNNRIISLSITSCKRLNFLKSVLRSFSIFCSDLNMIDNIIFFDDSSTDEDKNEMEKILNKYFPNQNKIITHFYPNSFSTQYRHANILNIWREKLIETKTDYCFHLEDDYLFVDFFELPDAINLLENYEEYAYVGYYHSLKQFPNDMKPKEIGNFWEWVYYPDKELNCNLFYDEVSAIQSLIPPHENNFWMAYINWPHFTLRPGIHNVEKLLSIGKFSENNSMELDFAIRWAKKWKAMCHKSFHIINLGINIKDSSYTLNDSER